MRLDLLHNLKLQCFLHGRSARMPARERGVVGIHLLIQQNTRHRGRIEEDYIFRMADARGRGGGAAEEDVESNTVHARYPSKNG